MKLDIQKLETVVIRDKDGKELVRIKPESLQIHTIGKKQYLTIYEQNQDESK